ncbi:MAG: hypothetical protein R3Y13_01295 [bacterium]
MREEEKELKYAIYTNEMIIKDSKKNIKNYYITMDIIINNEKNTITIIRKLDEIKRLITDENNLIKIIKSENRVLSERLQKFNEEKTKSKKRVKSKRKIKYIDESI